MIFPDYIYNYILELIINQLFNKDTNFEVFYYHLTNKTNEVVKLSLVNKRWFEMVSSNLENIINYKNYKSLKKLIALPSKNSDNSKKRKYQMIQDDEFDALSDQDYFYDSEEEEEIKLFGINALNQEIENNQVSNSKFIKNQFKLIQNHNLVKVYSTIQQYTKNKENSLKTKKVLIEPFGNANSVSILSGKRSIESNCEVDLWLSFDSIDHGSKLHTFINGDGFKGINNNVNMIFLRNSDLDQDLTPAFINKIICTLKPKKIEYYRNDVSINTHSVFFENNLLEALEFSDYFNYSEPKHVALINNQSSKLKSLSISLLFNSMTRLLNNCRVIDSDNEEQEEEENYEFGESCDIYQRRKEIYLEEKLESHGDDHNSEHQFKLDIKQEWTSMFKVLSNNSTIRDLALSEPCSYLSCRSKCVKNYPVDRSFISSGLASIFSSPVSRIENLLLDGLDIYNDPILLSSLANNQTISTLLLFSIDNLTPYFYQVLAKNHSIRNVVVERNIRINYLQLLLSTPNLDLYSLTVRVHKNDDIFNLINSLLNNQHHEPSIANINIKELTIYTSNRLLTQSSRIKSRYILNNNLSTILNIIYILDEYPLSSSFR